MYLSAGGGGGNNNTYTLNTVYFTIFVILIYFVIK